MSIETIAIDLIIIIPFVYLFLTKTIKAKAKPLYYTPWEKGHEARL